MNAPSVHLDRPQLLATARRIRRAADDMVTNSDKALDELEKAAKKDTSINTKSGDPAPLYSETLGQLTTGIEAARERVAATAATAREDAAALEAAARESATEDAANARSVGETDPQLPS